MWAGWCKTIHGNTNFPLTRVQQGCWLKVKKCWCYRNKSFFPLNDRNKTVQCFLGNKVPPQFKNFKKRKEKEQIPD